MPRSRPPFAVHPRHVVPALLAGVSVIAVPSVAFAQAPDAGTGSAGEASSITTLPTVTVQSRHSGDENVTEGSGSYTTRRARSATGLNLAPRETPQSVTVITRQRMDDQGVTTFNDETISLTRKPVA